MFKLPAHRSTGSPEIIGVLDVGTSKVVCAILARDLKAPVLANGRAGYRLIGFSKTKARGLKASVVMNLEDVTASIETVVEAAEKAARLTLDRVTLAVPTGRLKGTTIVASAALADGTVGDGDLQKIARSGHAYVAREGRRLLHQNAIAYHLDGGHAVADPRGLLGQRLSADIHIVSADETPVQHLLQAVAGANLGVEKLVPTPLASALAIATDEERRRGVIVLDFGAGSTTLALFSDGHLVHVAALPIGGNHMTYDLSRSFQVSIPEAERIKTNYGTLIHTQVDAHQAIPFEAASGRSGQSYDRSRVVTVADVREVLAERAGRILAMVYERIEAVGLPAEAFQSVVMSGGAAKLTGLVATVSRALARPVRLGEPDPMATQSQSLRVPEFATVSGLIRATLDGSVGQRIEQPASEQSTGKIGRFGRWLRESF